MKKARTNHYNAVRIRRLLASLTSLCVHRDLCG